MSNKFMKYSMIFLCLFFLHPFFGITLDESIEIALKNNTDLKKQYIELQKAEREKKSSWNQFLSNISVSGGISNSHPFGNGEASWNWNGSAGISLGFSFGIPSKIKQLALNYDIALINYKQKEQALIINVATAFYNLLAAYDNIAILQDNLVISQDQYLQVQRNYNSGLASELELLNAQYSYLSAGPALEEAKISYTGNISDFCILIGSDETVIPEGDIVLKQLKLPSVDELINLYLDSRLDIKKEKQNLELLKLTSSITKLNALAPSFSVSENVRISPTAGLGSELASNGSFSVSVSVPLDGFIPGSSKNLTIKNANDNLDFANESIAKVQKIAMQDIEKKAAAVNQNWRSLDIANMNYKISERSFELSQEGYRAGLVSQTNLELSKQQMVSAWQGRTQKEVAYLLSCYALADALNITVEQLYQLYGVAE